MSIIRAQVHIASESLIPEDVIMNTWHFLTTATPPTAPTLTAIHNALVAFYQAIDDTVFSNYVGPTAEVKQYDLGDPKPRSPLMTAPFTLVSSNSAYPAEVAIAASFQAAKTSGVNMARRRGRVFLGPIAATAGTTGPLKPVITSTVRNLIAASLGNLLTASDANADWEWAVYSPTDNAAVAVKSGWVDDAFDTIRSRGPKPAARSTFGTV